MAASLACTHPLVAHAAPSPDAQGPAAAPSPSSGAARTPKERRFLLGLEGVAIQTPPIRPRAVTLDSRYIGNTTTLGGVGLIARYRVVDLIAFDFGVRSGSLRFRTQSREQTISQDLVLADVGVAMFAARGQYAHLAVAAGWGGIYNRIHYEHGPQRTGTQHYASASLRVGVEVEILLRRVAFLFALRSHGVVTLRDNVRATGALFEGEQAASPRAPVSTFQTYLAGSFGVAYRF